MTAHNDKVEAVARAIAEADGQMWEGLSLQYAYMTQAEAVLTFMEAKGWLKADASRSVSSPKAAGQPGVWPDFMAPPEYENPSPRWRDAQLPDFHEIWRIARTHGYAVALHGSMRRDCDLIAAPWVDNPSLPEVLIDALCARLGAKVVGELERKPHGRIAWNIQIDGWFKLIDISVLPAARSDSEDTEQAEGRPDDEAMVALRLMWAAFQYPSRDKRLADAARAAARSVLFGDSEDTQLEAATHKLVDRQQPLGQEFERVWDESSDKLYDWDTQQAEGAANPLQELIKAAEKICAKYPLDYDANELQLALQNVKKSDK